VRIGAQVPALPSGQSRPNETAFFLKKLLSETLFILQEISFIFRVLSKHQLINPIGGRSEILGREE